MGVLFQGPWPTPLSSGSYERMRLTTPHTGAGRDCGVMVEGHPGRPKKSGPETKNLTNTRAKEASVAGRGLG